MPTLENFMHASMLSYSEAVYTASLQPLLKADGSPFVTHYIHEGIGMAATAYVTENNEVIIAYKGTAVGFDAYGAGSAFADMKLAVGGIPQSYEMSLQFARDVLKYTDENNISRDKVFLSGHSLGGGEAQFVAQNTSLGGATFGAPGIPNGFTSYQGGQTVPAFKNYVNYGDPVGTLSNNIYHGFLGQSTIVSHYGDVEMVGSASDMDLLDPLKDIFLLIPDFPYLPSHWNPANIPLYPVSIITNGLGLKNHHFATEYARLLNISPPIELISKIDKPFISSPLQESFSKNVVENIDLIKFENFDSSKIYSVLIKVYDADLFTNGIQNHRLEIIKTTNPLTLQTSILLTGYGDEINSHLQTLKFKNFNDYPSVIHFEILGQNHFTTSVTALPIPPVAVHPLVVEFPYLKKWMFSSSSADEVFSLGNFSVENINNAENLGVLIVNRSGNIVIIPENLSTLISKNAEILYFSGSFSDVQRDISLLGFHAKGKLEDFIFIQAFDNKGGQSTVKDIKIDVSFIKHSIFLEKSPENIYFINKEYSLESIKIHNIDEKEVIKVSINNLPDQMFISYEDALRLNVSVGGNSQVGYVFRGTAENIEVFFKNITFINYEENFIPLQIKAENSLGNVVDLSFPIKVEKSILNIDIERKFFDKLFYKNFYQGVFESSITQDSILSDNEEIIKLTIKSKYSFLSSSNISVYDSFKKINDHHLEIHAKKSSIEDFIKSFSFIESSVYGIDTFSFEIEDAYGGYSKFEEQVEFYKSAFLKFPADKVISMNSVVSFKETEFKGDFALTDMVMITIISDQDGIYDLKPQQDMWFYVEEDGRTIHMDGSIAAIEKALQELSFIRNSISAGPITFTASFLSNDGFTVLNMEQSDIDYIAVADTSVYFDVYFSTDLPSNVFLNSSSDLSFVKISSLRDNALLDFTIKVNSGMLKDFDNAAWGDDADGVRISSTEYHLVGNAVQLQNSLNRMLWISSSHDEMRIEVSVSDLNGWEDVSTSDIVHIQNSTLGISANYKLPAYEATVQNMTINTIYSGYYNFNFSQSVGLAGEAYNGLIYADKGELRWATQATTQSDITYASVQKIDEKTWKLTGTLSQLDKTFDSMTYVSKAYGQDVIHYEVFDTHGGSHQGSTSVNTPYYPLTSTMTLTPVILNTVSKISGFSLSGSDKTAVITATLTTNGGMILPVGNSVYTDDANYVSAAPTKIEFVGTQSQIQKSLSNISFAASGLVDPVLTLSLNNGVDPVSQTSGVLDVQASVLTITPNLRGDLSYYYVENANLLHNVHLFQTQSLVQAGDRYKARVTTETGELTIPFSAAGITNGTYANVSKIDAYTWELTGTINQLDRSLDNMTYKASKPGTENITFEVQDTHGGYHKVVQPITLYDRFFDARIDVSVFPKALYLEENGTLGAFSIFSPHTRQPFTVSIKGIDAKIFAAGNTIYSNDDGFSKQISAHEVEITGTAAEIQHSLNRTLFTPLADTASVSFTVKNGVGTIDAEYSPTMNVLHTTLSIGASQRYAMDDLMIGASYSKGYFFDMLRTDTNPKLVDSYTALVSAQTGEFSFVSGLGHHAGFVQLDTHLWKLTGSRSQIDYSLEAMSYLPKAPGNDTITVELMDRHGGYAKTEKMITATPDTAADNLKMVFKPELMPQLLYLNATTNVDFFELVSRKDMIYTLALEASSGSLKAETNTGDAVSVQIDDKTIHLTGKAAQIKASLNATIFKASDLSPSHLELKVLDNGVATEVSDMAQMDVAIAPISSIVARSSAKDMLLNSKVGNIWNFDIQETILPGVDRLMTVYLDSQDGTFSIPKTLTNSTNPIEFYAAANQLDDGRWMLQGGEIAMQRSLSGMSYTSHTLGLNEIHYSLENFHGGFEEKTLSIMSHTSSIGMTAGPVGFVLGGNSTIILPTTIFTNEMDYMTSGGKRAITMSFRLEEGKFGDYWGQQGVLTWNTLTEKERIVTGNVDDLNWSKRMPYVVGEKDDVLHVKLEDAFGGSYETSFLIDVLGKGQDHWW